MIIKSSFMGIRRSDEGNSSKAIARKLNDSDIPPPNGKRWEDRTITRALRNPITRGHYTWEMYL